MKDDAFIRGKNPMTKMEVRNTIVDYLALDSAKNVIEIGAGTGSVTVQMGKCYPHLHITAVEQTETGIALIEQNAKLHKVQNIIPVLSKAPFDLKDHTIAYDRAYIGGTGAAFQSIMSWLESDCLADDSIVVFSTITLENTSEICQYLFENVNYTDIEGSQVAASRLETLGRYHYFKPLNPCTIIKAKFKKQRGEHE